MAMNRLHINISTQPQNYINSASKVCTSTQPEIAKFAQKNFDLKVKVSCYGKKLKFKVLRLELVSKELNHFGVIADLFRQIGVTVVDLCYFAFF